MKRMNKLRLSCCFFGHRDSPESIKPKLKDNIVNLITKYNVSNFYVGNNGNFDSIVISLLKEIVNEYPDVSFNIVIAYLPKELESKQEKNTLYPFGIESVPKRYCISWRNKWLIDHSQFVICYVTHITGGAAKLMEIAIKKNKTVINIS